MDFKWTVIGISGCTNAGKTTLANAIKNHFPGSVVVKQDDFFRPDDSKEHVYIPELKHVNYEHILSVNWVAMLDRLTDIMQQPLPKAKSLLIVEGHIILNFPKLRNLFHKSFFLTLNKEECFKRRSGRVYDPPDVPGYVDLCVWPMYLRNLEDIRKESFEVNYIDGCWNKERIVEKVVMDINNFFEKNV